MGLRLRLTIATIEQQTGWSRPGPVALCQKRDVLERVYMHDYNLSNHDFWMYMDERGLQHILPEVGDVRLDFLVDHKLSTEEYQRQIRAGSFGISDSMAAYTLAVHRGILQDAWELFIEYTEG